MVWKQILKGQMKIHFFFCKLNPGAAAAIWRLNQSTGHCLDENHDSAGKRLVEVTQAPGKITHTTGPAAPSTTHTHTHKQMAKRTPEGSVEPSVDYSYHFQQGDDIDFLGDFGWECLCFERCLSRYAARHLSVSVRLQNQPVPNKTLLQLINKRFNISPGSAFLKRSELCFCSQGPRRHISSSIGQHAAQITEESPLNPGVRVRSPGSTRSRGQVFMGHTLKCHYLLQLSKKKWNCCWKLESSLRVLETGSRHHRKVVL